MRDGCIPDSIAIFGSVARGDGDRLSDRDVLVVSDDQSTQAIASKRFRANGWSPVCFNWRRFNNAAVGQGLFMQHLKLEAAIVRDRDGRLRESLNRFCVRPEYQREIAGAQELLGVLEKMPDCIAGRYWALDVLSVGLRTLGVATLANHGIYEFSLKRILNGLQHIGVLRSGDREYLQAIRQYKWRHRTAKIRPPLSLRDALRLVELVSRRFHLGLHVRSVQPEETLEIMPTADRLSPNWYLRSRVFERALLAVQPRTCSTREYANLKRNLQQLVKEPSHYGWQLRMRWPNLIDQLGTISTNSEIRFSSS